MYMNICLSSTMLLYLHEHMSVYSYSVHYCNNIIQSGSYGYTMLHECLPPIGELIAQTVLHVGTAICSFIHV